ncbi:hypothetical protein MYMAC_002733 [Corallococcus macrosporus DSM 14697]|uniref:Uncharacterized protein n=1 Tax=Corallococcus macrosporus DSM 14697 TaxID=1189310 RepID=A0A250JVH9_9BACT|nr:hypothetical protein MYMAC_002733 [Corallococcus macrosporus DSM 14697]
MAVRGGVMVVMPVLAVLVAVVLVVMVPGAMRLVVVPVRAVSRVVVVSVVSHGGYSGVREEGQGVSGQSMTSAPSSTATCTVGWSSQTPGEVAFWPVSMSKPTS